ncbi:MAG: hypothetical protein KJP00_01365 [Bacteroidia bacterium]|nr:hypothetical protein [Bacteroidia bacterium]
MFLIFQTAGAGKPLSWKARPDEVFNWPRMMAISWILLGEDRKPISNKNYLIKPEGYNFKDEYLTSCSIDIDEMEKHGESLSDILDDFVKTAGQAKFVFAHNMKLNTAILGAEFIRSGKDNPLRVQPTYCIMEEATFYTKLPKKGGGFKWPTLQEAHTKIFKQGYSPARNARADVIAASRVLLALLSVGGFEDIFEE